jgi:serine/threonine protein phosphatase PrpC
MPIEAHEPASLAIDAAVVSVCGPVREVNEDAALVLTGESGQVVGVVSDGMGGHEAGRQAAEIVVRVASERLRPSAAEPWGERLAQALEAVHAEVQAAARSRSQPGMGATALLAVIEPGRELPILHLAHVGDSRASLLRGRTLLRLTGDHSLVGQLVRDGHLTEREAFQHPERNVLQRAIGQAAPLEPEVQRPLLLDAGDRLLLTSDGLHGALSDEEIERLAEACLGAAEICERLVAAALAAASDDNVSVVCLRLAEAPSRPTRPGSAAVVRDTP